MYDFSTSLPFETLTIVHIPNVTGNGRNHWLPLSWQSPPKWQSSPKVNESWSYVYKAELDSFQARRSKKITQVCQVIDIVFHLISHASEQARVGKQEAILCKTWPSRESSYLWRLPVTCLNLQSTTKPLEALPDSLCGSYTSGFFQDFTLWWWCQWWSRQVIRVTKRHFWRAAQAKGKDGINVWMWE